MKKRNIKNLQLNKTAISNMNVDNPIGGRDSNNRQCYSEQRVTACYWDQRCETIHPRLCL
ncbi:MAG: hypothetical protein AAF617_03505 [Bacteroidota bacterium]